MFDLATTLAAQRRHLAAELRALPIPDRAARLRDACVETGGHLVEPDQLHGPVEVEISMLGVFHSGDSIEMAIANWIKAAERCTPQPTPKSTD